MVRYCQLTISLSIPRYIDVQSTKTKDTDYGLHKVKYEYRSLKLVKGKGLSGLPRDLGQKNLSRALRVILTVESETP